jgi:hypothetical protein
LTSVAIIDGEVDEEAEDDVEENRLLKKYDGQNETKKQAVEARGKMKESKVRLLFEKKKKVHTEDEKQEFEDQEPEEEVENEFDFIEDEEDNDGEEY